MLAERCLDIEDFVWKAFKRSSGEASPELHLRITFNLPFGSNPHVSSLFPSKSQASPSVTFHMLSRHHPQCTLPRLQRRCVHMHSSAACMNRTECAHAHRSCSVPPPTCCSWRSPRNSISRLNAHGRVDMDRAWTILIDVTDGSLRVRKDVRRVYMHALCCMNR